jgi:PAS domain S-box-containing protein
MEETTGDRTGNEPDNYQKSTEELEQVRYSSIDTRVDISISNILDALPFYVLLIDEDHYILQSNRAVQKQFGVNPREIIGQYCPKIIHGLDKPFEGCPLEEAVEKDRSVELEILDPQSGHWVSSAIYPTGTSTKDGKRVYFHMISDITARKQAEERLRASHEELHNLTAHLESVREEERTSLAREMHDELGQMLTALKFDISWLAKRLPEDSRALLGKTEAMHKLVDNTIEKVQEISAELRPGVLDDLGLSAALEWQASEFENRTGISCEFSSDPEDIILSPDRSIAIFRVFQETLTNVARHAQATKVKVKLRKQDDKLVLRVEDNGKGIEKKQILNAESFGLIGMKERAQTLGGTVKITGSPGKGTKVLASIPLVGGGNFKC